MENLTLSFVAYCLGTFFVLINLPFILAPVAWRRALLAFPRSRIPAYLLAALDLAWFGWLLYHEPLWEFFKYVRPWLWLLMPVLTILVCIFMDELLAARALGGLLLLVAGPILDTARWHPSPWRYLLIVLAYVWIAAGIIFVLSPYRVRRFFEFITRTDLRCRVGGSVRLVIGLLLLWLGWKIF
ncbi:MAG: DUF2065 family protein [Kiritimatiellaeota bacterium]|nr:DUF2065 family protein [Kiritimatiellota bacterium]